MKAKTLAVGLLTLCLFYSFGCGPETHLAVGDTGTIVSKDSVFAAMDRPSYEGYVNALHTDDKVAQVNFMVHGSVFSLRAGTKVTVLLSYMYSGSTVYKVRVLDGLHEGEEVFVNFFFVEKSK